MSITRSLSGPLVCARCQFRVLETFAAVSGSSIAPLAVSVASPFATRRISPFRARSRHGQSFTTSLRPQNDQVSAGTDENSLKIDELQADGVDTEEQKPWYLQVQDEQAPLPARLESQKLPEVPSDVPSTVQDIIDRLSRVVGLDYLSLLDLRALDPPPALGNNLIMILGTARSEKHLNSSADRFCRWMRSVYKMQPVADGLLGRNEMKLKLRRKSRRAKLLGGRPQIGPVDDGITTGWISVDLGPIGEEAETEATLQGSSGDVSGFGVVDNRIRLVVQMMTEEKREELKLEELWTGFLEDQHRKERVEGSEITPSESIERPRTKKSKSERSERFAGRPRRNSTIADMPFVQRRTFSTFTSRLNSLQQAETAPVAELADVANGVQSASGRVSSSQKDGYLQQCLHELEGLSEAEILQALGKDSQDHSSTPFLKRFYGHIGVLASEAEWKACFQLLDQGRRLNHPGYPVDALVALLREMEESCTQISAEIYTIVLNALQTDQVQERPADATSKGAAPRQLETLLEILENMQLRKLPVSYPVALNALANEMWRQAVLAKETGVSKLGKRAATEVALAAIEVRARLDHQPLHIMALQELASRDQWDTFWLIWRSFPKREMARSANMYTAMFNLVASSRNQARCTEVLAEWIPEMEYERPPVKLEEAVAEAVIACIRVVEPDVDFKFEERLDSGNQMVRLYKRCYESID